MKLMSPCLAVEIRGPSYLLQEVMENETLREQGWVVNSERTFPSEEKDQDTVEPNSIQLLNPADRSRWDELIQGFSNLFDTLEETLDLNGDTSFQYRFMSHGAVDTDRVTGDSPVEMTSLVRVIPVESMVRSSAPYMHGDGNFTLYMESGWAFGTGAHPSTVSCVKSMEWLWQEGKFDEESRILDMGTGTGILAILAVKFGAGHVTAVDIDPEAIRLARNNARLNGVDERMEVVDRDEFEHKKHGFDICLANLTLSVATRLMPAIQGTVATRGVLVLAGFKKGAVDTVQKLIGSHGFSVLEWFTHRDWCCAVSRKES